MDLVYSPMSLKNITSFFISKLFWNKSYEENGPHLNLLHHDRERNWEIHLTKYRDEVIHNINTFIEKNKFTSFLKIILIDSVFLLHEAYHQLLLWKLNYDKNDRIDIMQEGEFYAPNFFSADGKFNDIFWTKRLMWNPNYPAAFRFSLAVAYHFQVDIVILWEMLSSLGHIPDEDGFNILGVCNDFNYFKGLVEGMEIHIEEAEYHDRQEMDFYSQYLFILAQNGCEYAFYAFWKTMSCSKQSALMKNDSYFEMINTQMDFPRCKISNFLYSQLSRNRKTDLFDWSLQHNASEMWLSLLLTSSGGNLYFEILEFINKLPIFHISKLLQLLSHRIRQLKLPLDAELFETLWNEKSLEVRLEILKNGTFIIENLVKARSFYIIGCIVKKFSLAQKSECLLNRLYNAGINILDILCKEGEFDLMQKYLSFFLNEEDSRNNVYILRRRHILLNTFSESFEFKEWYVNKLSKEGQTEVKSRIEYLKISSYGQNNCYEDIYKLYTSSKISIFKKHFS